MTIIAANEVSGPSKGLFQIISCLKSKDVEFWLYNFMFNNRIPDRFIQGAEEQGIKVKLFTQKNKSYLALIRQAINEVKKHHFQVIQTHGFKPSLLGLCIKIADKNVKWICFLHGMTSENIKVKIYNFLDHLFQFFSDLTVLVSKSQLNKILSFRNKSKIRIISNAVDVENPLPVSTEGSAGLSVKKTFGIDPDTRILVVIGRLSPEKGVDIFIDAFGLLKDRIQQNLHAIIVGDGQEMRKLKSMVAIKDLKPYIHFTGFTTTPGDYAQIADIIVVPSRSEGSPNVVLESMAIGKTVLAASVGGVPEIIEDQIDGVLFPTERSDLLADAIDDLLSNPERLNCIGQKAKTKIEQEFTVKSRADKVFSIYREVIG